MQPKLLNIMLFNLCIMPRTCPVLVCIMPCTCLMLTGVGDTWRKIMTESLT